MAAFLPFLLPSSAKAAYPGVNGRIVFEGFNTQVSIKPDGTGAFNLGRSCFGQVSFFPSANRMACNSLAGISTAYANGTDITQLGSSGSDPAVSANGQRIAYSGAGPDIWLMDADGTDQTQLTSMAFATTPSFSPDGQKVVFFGLTDYNNIDGTSGIYSINVNGTGLTKLTAGRDHGNPSYSPNGQKIVFDRGGTGGRGGSVQEVWIMNASGTSETRLRQQAIEPVFSPDGAKVLFTGIQLPAGGSAYRALFLMNPDGTNVTHLVGTSQLSDSHTAEWAPLGETDAPDTTITAGPLGAYPGEGPYRVFDLPQVSFVADEPNSAFLCSLNGQASGDEFGRCNPPIDVSSTASAVGSHSFSVRAVDTSGNIESSAASRSWTMEPWPGGDCNFKVRTKIRARGETRRLRAQVNYVDGSSCETSKPIVIGWAKSCVPIRARECEVPRSNPVNSAPSYGCGITFPKAENRTKRSTNEIFCVVRDETRNVRRLEVSFTVPYRQVPFSRNFKERDEANK